MRLGFLLGLVCPLLLSGATDSRGVLTIEDETRGVAWLFSKDDSSIPTTDKTHSPFFFLDHVEPLDIGSLEQLNSMIEAKSIFVQGQVTAHSFQNTYTVFVVNPIFTYDRSEVYRGAPSVSRKIEYRTYVLVFDNDGQLKDQVTCDRGSSPLAFSITERQDWVAVDVFLEGVVVFEITPAGELDPVILSRQDFQGLAAFEMMDVNGDGQLEFVMPAEQSVWFRSVDDEGLVTVNSAKLRYMPGSWDDPSFTLAQLGDGYLVLSYPGITEEDGELRFAASTEFWTTRRMNWLIVAAPMTSRNNSNARDVVQRQDALELVGQGN